MVFSGRSLGIAALFCCIVLAFIRREQIRNNRVTWSGLRSFLNGGERISQGFTEDIEAGLTSNEFDLAAHNADDQRNGLDDDAKNQIKDIMNQDRVDFNQARLTYLRRQFSNNNIAADGMPLDPKAVAFGK
ncbi:LAFA_0G14378g1_1 [Lachancea sp. 'fantastica']|nr:LAFA_0G14378g1_1 [Lachancea sp. 'fantastica']